MSSLPALLQLSERPDADGTLRVSLRGELDLGTEPLVVDRLRELASGRSRVRLDVSGLDFMATTGVTAICRSLQDARETGCDLDVDRRLSGQVAWLVALLGAERLWWPPAREPPARLL